jgi:hypothetical protein
MAGPDDPGSLSVFNNLGQQVAQLVNEEQEAGFHEARFDGSNLASGMYFYRLHAGTFVETKEFLLLREVQLVSREREPRHHLSGLLLFPPEYSASLADLVHLTEDPH